MDYLVFVIGVYSFVDLHSAAYTETWLGGQGTSNSVRLGLSYLYGFEEESPKNHTEAVKECKTKGSVLASFHSAEETGQLLQEIIPDPGETPTLTSLWIGLHASVEGSDWLDKSIVDYQHGSVDLSHAPGEPCVTWDIVDDTWQTTDCSEQHGFVCIGVGSFISNHTFRNGTGYLGLSAAQSSFSESRASCQKRPGNSDLITFMSSEEYDFVKRVYTEMTKSAHSGLTKPSQFWIGGKFEAGSFQWIDGTQDGYTRSVDGAGEKADSCVSWNVEEDSWEGTACGAKLAHLCLIWTRLGNNGETLDADSQAAEVEEEEESKPIEAPNASKIGYGFCFGLLSVIGLIMLCDIPTFCSHLKYGCYLIRTTEEERRKDRKRKREEEERERLLKKKLSKLEKEKKKNQAANVFMISQGTVEAK